MNSLIYIYLFIRLFITFQELQVYNLSELKNEMNEVLDLVDHKNLDLDVPYFTDNVSTTENLVVYLWSELKCRMKNPSLLYKSVLHETDKNIFAYQG